MANKASRGAKERAARKRSGPVTAELVIDVALRLIDDEGLEALTMRRLAQELGVEPMTVYRQIPNKEAMLAGVAERLWAEGPGSGAPPVETATDDWRAQVRAMWLGLHRLMQDHPNAIPILARGGVHSSSTAAVMADLFRRGGLSPEQAAELVHIIGASVVGFAFATLWSRHAAKGDRPDEPAGEPRALPAELQPYLQRITYWDPRHFEKALDMALAAYGEHAS